MRNIIIINNNMHIGGIQKSLLNLLHLLGDYYNITLLLFSDKGEYMDSIPKSVKVIRASSLFRCLGMSQMEAKKEDIYTYIIRAFLVCITRVLGRKFAMKLILASQKKLKEEFDCGISYMHEAPQSLFVGGCNEFVLKKIVAKKKIAWIHCDLEELHIDLVEADKIYKGYDWIVGCSDGTRDIFVKCLPKLKQKAISIRNINNYEEIAEMAKNYFKYDKKYFNIITVARLSNEKGIDRAIKAVKYCVDRGFKIHYHIVGDGGELSTLKKLVCEYGLEDIIYFYGNKKNPYIYIKDADLFMLTSYHEAAPMVFDEATFLGVPIFSTKTTSTNEMIEESKCGYVCDNCQNAINDKLCNILEHREELYKLKKDIEDRSFNNEVSLKKIVSIFE